MTFTRAIGVSCNKVIRLIVHGLALSKIHPNVLTFFGLVINIVAAVLLAAGQFRSAGFVIIGAVSWRRCKTSRKTGGSGV